MGKRRLLHQRSHHHLDGSQLLSGLLEWGRDTLGRRVLSLPVPGRGDDARTKATTAGGRPVPLSQRAHTGTPGGVTMLHDDG
jgi:hypothetical protein